jgi:type IV secretion system protein VirB1
MAGLIEHESSWKVYAIGDNDAHRSYFPTDYRSAVRIATNLRAQGHNIDAGLGQVNSDNWSRFGLTAQTVFNPCLNVHAGSIILLEAYKGALTRFAPGDEALTHALSAYNSGGYYASMGYASAVIGNARAVSFPPPAIAALEALHAHPLPATRGAGAVGAAAHGAHALPVRSSSTSLVALPVKGTP